MPLFRISRVVRVHHRVIVEASDSERAHDAALGCGWYEEDPVRGNPVPESKWKGDRQANIVVAADGTVTPAYRHPHTVEGDEE